MEQNKKYQEQLAVENNINPENIPAAELQVEEREVVKDTPFVLSKVKAGWVITVAGMMICPTPFETKEDAMKRLDEKHWSDIIIATMVFMEYTKKSQKKLAKNNK